MVPDRSARLGEDISRYPFRAAFVVVGFHILEFKADELSVPAEHFPHAFYLCSIEAGEYGIRKHGIADIRSLHCLEILVLKSRVKIMEQLLIWSHVIEWVGCKSKYYFLNGFQ